MQWSVPARVAGISGQVSEFSDSADNLISLKWLRFPECCSYKPFKTHNNAVELFLSIVSLPLSLSPSWHCTHM